jgi:hypothetical protein
LSGLGRLGSCFVFLGVLPSRSVLLRSPLPGRAAPPMVVCFCFLFARFACAPVLTVLFRLGCRGLVCVVGGDPADLPHLRGCCCY